MVLEEGGHGRISNEQNIVSHIHYDVMDAHQLKTNSRWPISAKYSKT